MHKGGGFQGGSEGWVAWAWISHGGLFNPSERGFVESSEKALLFRTFSSTRSDISNIFPGYPHHLLREGPRRFSQREFEGGAPESNQAQTGRNYIPVYLHKYRNIWFYFIGKSGDCGRRQWAIHLFGKKKCHRKLSFLNIWSIVILSNFSGQQPRGPLSQGGLPNSPERYALRKYRK